MRFQSLRNRGAVGAPGIRLARRSFIFQLKMGSVKTASASDMSVTRLAASLTRKNNFARLALRSSLMTFRPQAGLVSTCAIRDITDWRSRRQFENVRYASGKSD